MLPLRLQILLGLSVGLSGCAALQARTGAGADGQQLPPALLLTLPEGAALRLSGSVEGPLAGLGPSLIFDLWLRGAQMRADLHYEEEGRPRHEVLLWTPENVLLFDRDRGGLTELGADGRLPAWGTAFSLESLLWLGLGRWPSDRPLAFQREGRDWAAIDGELRLHGRSVDRSGHLSQSSIRWQQDGATRELSAVFEAQMGMLDGKIPQRVRLDGDDLEHEVQLRISSQVVENVSDSVFDPLTDP